jgi:hypothetical protein
MAAPGIEDEPDTWQLAGFGGADSYASRPPACEVKAGRIRLKSLGKTWIDASATGPTP